MSNGMGIDGMIVGRIGRNRDAVASFFYIKNYISVYSLLANLYANHRNWREYCLQRFH